MGCLAGEGASGGGSYGHFRCSGRARSVRLVLLGPGEACGHCNAKAANINTTTAATHGYEEAPPHGYVRTETDVNPSSSDGNEATDGPAATTYEYATSDASDDGDSVHAAS